MAEHNQELLAALARSDLEPFMASMSFGEQIPVFISLKKLAPCKWGPWGA